MKNSEDDPNRNLLLRCDNPECIRFFPTRRSWLAAKKGKHYVDTEGLDPCSLRTEGNAAFAGGKYETASRLYIRALDCQWIENSDKVACLSNLSEARIRQCRWEAAAASARKALQLDPDHLKAKFRLATALTRLDEIEEAAALVSVEKRSREFQNLRGVVERLSNEKSGRYDTSKMRKEESGRLGEALLTFHANFTSSKIRQRVMIEKECGFIYRGTVATDCIKSGTLVSSSKALVFCPGRMIAGMMAVGLDPYRKQALDHTSVTLENDLISLMSQRPSLRGVVYSLSAGPGDTETIGCNKIDPQLIRDIVASNSFASYNDFEEAWIQHKTIQIGSDQHETQPARGSGLWVNESFFNHSCMPNCRWHPIGDQMFVTTLKDVQKGEELTISYVALDSSFAERKETFKNWVAPGIGFSCQCDWCHTMRGQMNFVGQMREPETLSTKLPS